VIDAGDFPLDEIHAISEVLIYQSFTRKSAMAQMMMKALSGKDWRELRNSAHSFLTT
jgi:hypothetical protein